MQYNTCEELLVQILQFIPFSELLKLRQLRHLNDMLLKLKMQEVLDTLTQALRPWQARQFFYSGHSTDQILTLDRNRRLV